MPHTIPPPKITKILRGRGWLKVEWEPSENPQVHEYRVFRTVDGGGPVYVKTVLAPDTYYTDYDIENGHTYGYRIRAAIDTRLTDPLA